MNIPHCIFKAYDIRGIYPKEINEENIIPVSKAIYTFFSEKLQTKQLQIVLARDMRLSSPKLFDVVRETLVKAGATVIDIGLASTPTFYFTCLKFGYDAGILISASHNPPQYNGIKFVTQFKNKIIKIAKNTGIDKVRELAVTGKFPKNSNVGKVIEKKDILKDEIDFVFNSLNPKYIKKSKVVADPANAMGILYLEKVFERLPCKLIRMNFKLDGSFPAHQPDPLKFETLTCLQKKVLEENADLGIATDGDGDRVFFIDEKGNIIPATAITTIIAKEILTKNPNEKIIADVRYTRNVRNIVQQYGGVMLESAVGHSLITDQLNKEEAAFAGESSGHFYYRENGGAENSIRTILHVLDVIGKEQRSISQITSGLTTYVESGEYNFVLKKGITKDDIFSFFSKEYKDADSIYYTDGISVEYPRWRFNIRASNTEPLLRLNLESNSVKLMQEKLAKVSNQILNQGAVQKK